MKELYEELQTRLKVLESRKLTPITEARIAELQLVIIRVQQLILASTEDFYD